MNGKTRAYTQFTQRVIEVCARTIDDLLYYVHMIVAEIKRNRLGTSEDDVLGVHQEGLE